MKANIFKAGFIVLFLIFGSAYFVRASIFAKSLPTYEALKDKLIAEANGFKGAAAKEVQKRQLTEDNAQQWNNCVEASPAAKEVTKLGQQLVVILQYYEVTGGSDEAADNFDKWIKDLHKAWVTELDEVTACYDKATRI